MNARRVDALNYPALESKLSYIGVDSWMNFVRDIYGHPIHRFAVLDGDRPLGALSLAEIRHPLFGHYLATAPFGSYGGFAYENDEARDVLLEEARRLALEVNAEYVSLRFASAATPPDGWVQHPVYSSYLIDLPADPNDLLKKFSSDHRNHIRKALKKGFTIRFGHLDLLDDAYEAIARSMHELGSPYHAKRYLRRMAERLGETLQFAVTYDAQRRRITGGGVFIYQHQTIFNLHANILRFARASYAGEFLYWSVIEHAIQKGLSTFDLGRSLIGSGNDLFKSKWAPRKETLAYWYWLAPGHDIPSLNQKSPKFQLAIAVWKRLPVFVVRPLGPHLIRGLV